MLEPTLTTGNLISIAVTIASVGASAWKITARLVKLEAEYELKMKLLWKDYERRHGMNDGTDHISKNN